MGLFTRKKKSQETVSGFKLIHDLKVPLVPFGENIMKSDVVMISVDRVASQCAKLKARYIKVDEKGVQSEKNGRLHERQSSGRNGRLHGNTDSRRHPGGRVRTGFRGDPYGKSRL